MPADAPAQVAGYVDGERIIELAWNEEKRQPDFLVYDRVKDEVTRTETAVTSLGPIQVPAFWRGTVTPGGPILGSVFVPTECDTSPADGVLLRADITAFINRYVELPSDVVPLAVEYVLLTWVHDVFDELPYLAFRAADKGMGKSRALEDVGALCYRPLLVGGGSTAAATLRMIDALGGTLVADEFDHKRHTDLAATLAKILNQGFQRNRPLYKCHGEDNTPRAFQCFGPKVFATRQPFEDDATESRTLVVRMKPRTRDVPLNLPRQQFDAEALALRNRLVGWRFRKLGCVSIDPGLAVPDLEDRLNQIGLPLLSIAQTTDVRQRIAGALRDQQREIAAGLSETPAGRVFRLLVDDYQLGDLVSPKELAGKINLQDVASMTGRRATPEKIGPILRHELGLPRAPRSSQGVRYKLDPERMERLAGKYGVSLKEPAQPTQQPARDIGCQGASSED